MSKQDQRGKKAFILVMETVKALGRPKGNLMCGQHKPSSAEWLDKSQKNFRLLLTYKNKNK